MAEYFVYNGGLYSTDELYIFDQNGSLFLVTYDD